MIYSSVLSALENWPVSVYSIYDGDAEIHGMRFLTDSCSVGGSSTLYVCFPFQIPTNVPNNYEVYNFLVLGTPSDIHDTLRESRINLAFVEQFDAPNEILNLISDELSRELSIAQTIRCLTNALLSNAGLQHIIDTAYDIFKNPIIVIDPSDKHIAKAFGSESVEPGTIFANFLRDESLYGYVEEAGRDFREQIGLPEILRKRTVYRFFHEVFQKETLMGLIRVKGIKVGRIILIAQYHDFGELDEQLFSCLLSLVGQELQKKALFTKNRNETKAYFLNDLLSIQDLSEKMINRRLKELAITINEKLYVAVVRVSDDSVHGDDATLYDMIAEQLYPVLSGSIYLIRSSELIILFNLTYDKSMSGFINKKLKQQALTNKLNIGVSNMFHNLTQITKYYEQASRAIQIGASYRQYDVTYFNLAAPVELLNVVQRNDDLMNFCSPQLLNLLQEDQDNNSELMLTLYYFLETFGNTAKSADLLHIHKNTMLYRLSKIKQILQCELKSGEEIYSLMMSMRILRMSRIFSPPGDGPVFNIDDVE
jgi:sugar diacid utilization regulator